MKVLKNGQMIIDNIEIISDDLNEPITFNSKAELDNYIADFIVEFLTEGNENDNGSN